MLTIVDHFTRQSPEVLVDKELKTKDINIFISTPSGSGEGLDTIISFGLFSGVLF